MTVLGLIVYIHLFRVLRYVSLGPRHDEHETGKYYAGIDGPSRHLLDGRQRGLHLHLALCRHGSHVLCLCLALALILHASGCHVVGCGCLRICAVIVVGVTRDIILLAILEHHLIESRSDAGSYDHAHGEHYAHPCGEQLVRHALVGVDGDERVEEHHARGAYDDRPLHALQHSGCLYLKIHEQRGGGNKDEAQGEEPFEMDPLVVENKDGHQAYEIAQQDPVAEGCHLYLVCLHAHAHEDVDEHRAGVADHQSDEEQYAALYATQLERLEHEVRRAARLLKVEEQNGGEHTDSCCPADSWTVVPIVNLAVDRDIDERAAHEAEHHHVAELGERQRTVFCGVGVVRHAQKGDEQGHEYGTEHGIIDHLPVVVVGEPCRYPCAYLSEEHEEEIDDRLARLLLRVESVPSCLVDRLVAWRDVACGLYAEAILDEREEVAHEQGLPDEAHDQAVESEDEQAVGVGTDVALHSQ